jgi:hypothetical protein
VHVSGYGGGVRRAELSRAELCVAVACVRACAQPGSRAAMAQDIFYAGEAHRFLLP